MGTEQIVIAGGRAQVRDVGPPGPPGKQGPPGIPGSGGARRGIWLVPPTVEVIGETTFQVLDLSDIGNVEIVNTVVDPELPMDVYVKFPPIEDAFQEQSFLVVIQGFNEEIADVQVYVDLPTESGVGPVAIPMGFFWAYVGIDTQVQMRCVPLPGEWMGNPNDLWLPTLAVTATPARSGSCLVPIVSPSGEAGYDQEADLRSYAVNRAVVAVLDAEGDLMSGKLLLKMIDAPIVPFYLSIANAEITHIGVQFDNSSTVYEMPVPEGARFDAGQPVVSVVLSPTPNPEMPCGISPATPELVSEDMLDISVKQVIPTVGYLHLGLGGSGTYTISIPWNCQRILIDEGVAGGAIDLSFQNPGINKAARFRLETNMTADLNPVQPAYIDPSSDTVVEVGVYEVVVVGQGVANTGDPAYVLITEVN